MMSSGEPSGDEDATAQHGQYPSDDELLRYAHAAGRSGLLAIHVMDCAADDALDLESGIHLARGWYALAAIQARQKRAPVPALDDFVFSIDHSSLRFPADLPAEQWKKHLAVFEQAARRDPWRDVAADRIPLSDLRLHADLLCASAGAIADQIRHTGEARWWSPGAAGRLTVNVLRDFRFHGGSALLVLLVGYLGQRYNHPHAPWQAASFDNGVRRCCVNRNWHRALPRVGSSPIDRERLWSTKLGHSIEHVARKHRFDSLRCASPTSKSIAENRLVPEERVLDAGLSMIADLLLPSTAPNLADPSDRPIASARPRVASGQLGGLRRRHDDGRASGVGCLVEGERVVGSVRRDRPRAAGNGLDQIDARTRVIHRGIGQRLSDDHSRLVDSQMKLLPPTPPASSVFRRRPLTLADHRQASAVDEEVQGGAPGNASECEVEMLPAPGDSVVWSGDRRSRPIRWKSEVRKPSA